MERNPLGREEWRTRDWQCLEDVGQGLIDVGFDIAGVGEDLGEAVQAGSATERAELALQTLEQASQVCVALQQWFSRAVEAGWLSVGWPSPKLDELFAASSPFSSANEDAKSAESSVPIDLVAAREALIVIEYWGLQIALGALILGLQSHVSPETSIPSPCEAYGRAFQIQKAKDILAVMPYVCRPEHGFVFASRSIFSARITQYALRIHRAPDLVPLAERADAFVAFLSSRRGLKYATVLSRGAGKWREV